MSFRDRTINTLKSTSAGRGAYNALRKTVFLSRKITSPGLPPDQQISKVAYNGKNFEILHRRSSDDRGAISQCFEQKQYDMPTAAHGAFIERLYQKIVASGRQPLIIDCGANIGASVLWFSARYPKAHIVAVEPAPDNFAFLSKNAAGLDVDLRQAGIAAEDGHAHLVDPGEGSVGYQTHAGDQGPEVAMVSIHTLMAAKPSERYQPFILKVDIEGAERSLFAGDCTELNSFPLIVIEPHDWLFPGQGSSIEFFRFHAAAGREFCMNNENVASIAFQGELS